jgi:hypothetical protein
MMFSSTVVGLKLIPTPISGVQHFVKTEAKHMETLK